VKQFSNIPVRAVKSHERGQTFESVVWLGDILKLMNTLDSHIEATTIRKVLKTIFVSSVELNQFFGAGEDEPRSKTIFSNDHCEVFIATLLGNYRDEIKVYHRSNGGMKILNGEAKEVSYLKTSVGHLHPVSAKVLNKRYHDHCSANRHG
jgi:hypothetical protein